ncbi:MAG: WG repeat-containing protein [Defluviitaleaceae bacterium]|nr:WG repeat-containing protein [Defluviitaleaceae bacterium]MCL2836536.1 WG repeat-containing protein [Defluviitaleaceae bacterium]
MKKNISILVIISLLFCLSSPVSLNSNMPYDFVRPFNDGLAAVCRGDWKTGKWGYIDQAGNEVIPCVYDFAWDFNEGLAWVKRGDKVGFINTDGLEIIPFIYDGDFEYDLRFEDGFALVFHVERFNGKFGLIDREGNEVVPVIYDSIWPFSEGLAAVRYGGWGMGKWGYINESGHEVIPCQFDWAFNFTEGLARVNQDDKIGFINTDGHVVLPCTYDWAERFSEGLAAVRAGDWDTGLWGFIDREGNEVIPFIYEYAYSFSEGLAWVLRDGKMGVIDQTGAEVIPFIYDFYYNYINDSGEIADVAFENGIAKVLQGDEGVRESGYVRTGEWSYINRAGNEVILYDYDFTRDCNEGLAWTVIVPPIYDDVQSFSEGLAAACLDGYWGFIDKLGNAVVPFTYSYVDSFREGFAAVSIGDCWDNAKWGFIDKTGNVTVPLDYDMVGWFSDGLACVVKDGKIGYVNTTGEVVIPLIYEFSYYTYIYNEYYVKFFMPAFFEDEGLVSVMNAHWSEGGKYGYIDKAGNNVIPFEYDYAAPFSDGLAYVEKNGKFGYIGKSGEIVVPLEYDSYYEWEDIYYIENYFVNGAAKISVGNLYDDMKFGLVDKNGEIIIPVEYLMVTNFENGLAAVCVGDIDGIYNETNLWGFVDETGAEVVPVGTYSGVIYCGEGLWAVKSGGLWGLMDSDCNEIIPGKYKRIRNFYDGAAVAEFEGEWVIIDIHGNVVADLAYNFISYSFSEGFAEVYNGDWISGKRGFIDITGREVVPLIFDYAYEVSEGMAAVRTGGWKDGKWGFISVNN